MKSVEEVDAESKVIVAWRCVCAGCFLLLAQTLGHAAVATTIACPKQGGSSEYALPMDRQPLILTLSADAPSWIEIEEQGQAVDVTSVAATAQFKIQPPPRFGLIVLMFDGGGELSVVRTGESAAAASVRVRRHCSGPTRMLDWMRVAATISSDLQAAPKSLADNPYLWRIATLIASAPDAFSAALALHLRAQALMVNGRNQDADAAFAKAEMAWNGVGDERRALAARVGAASVALNAGAFDRVIELASRNQLSTSPYYAARLTAERCIALLYLANYGEAERCLQSAMADFEKMDEPGDLVNTMQSYAGLLILQGKDAQAEVLLRNARGRRLGPDKRLIEGRVEMTLSSIAVRHGNVPDAITDLESALDNFTVANDQRWEANVLLELAALYGDLGAQDEAYAAVGQAVKQLTFTDAPSRVASSYLVFSDLEQARGAVESARWSAYAAEQMFVSLKMPVQTESARLTRLELQMKSGDWEGVQKAPELNSSSKPSNPTRWSLLRLELALESNALVDAHVLIERLDLQSLTFRDQLRFAQLKATYANLIGDSEAAQRVLFAATAGINTLAQSTSNEILRRLIKHQLGPLRRESIDMELDWYLARAHDFSASTAREAIWRWARTYALSSRLSARLQTVPDVKPFDEAVASELLPTPFSSRRAGEADSGRKLLSIFGGSAREPAAHPTVGPEISLDAVRQSLDKDTVLVFYAAGTTRGGLLWIAKDKVDLLAAAAPGEVRARKSKLQFLLHSPETQGADIERASTELADAVFQSVPTEAPKRLLVIAEPTLDGIPWTILSWPGLKGRLLLESSAVSVVNLDLSGASALNSAIGPLRVFTAPQSNTNLKQLSVLVSAQTEGDDIVDEVGDRVRVVQVGAAKRNDVLYAFADSGSWVHVAAHGLAQPNRIGYSGLFLEPESPGLAPQYLSSFDVLTHGVRADLVVLNACQLGDSGDAVDGNLSFASAVSEAGAKQVVASLWPVSDAASSIWVPAFYAALTADSQHDAAAALRIAQLKLRDSRMFRHPFYWAGFQTFTRLALTSSSQSPSRTPTSIHTKVGKPH